MRFSVLARLTQTPPADSQHAWFDVQRTESIVLIGLKFGGSQGVSELHPLGRPFDASSGVRIASSLQFDQESNVRDQPVLSLLREGLGVFRRSKHELSAFDRPEGLHQLFHTYVRMIALFDVHPYTYTCKYKTRTTLACTYTVWLLLFVKSLVLAHILK